MIPLHGTITSSSDYFILNMSSIKHKTEHPHGVMTMDMYFENISKEVCSDYKKSLEVNMKVSKTEDDESSVESFSNYYNYSNYYNAKSLIITMNMNNMKTSPKITVMANNKKEVPKFKPYIKAPEFTEGEYKKYFVISILEIQQNFKGVLKTETITKVDLKTGKETEVTRPLKGYELTLVSVDDEDQVARLLGVNHKAAVAFVDQMVKERAKPIGVFVAGEEIELELVQNDFGYNPSILPVGA